MDRMHKCTNAQMQQCTNATMQQCTNARPRNFNRGNSPYVLHSGARRNGTCACDRGVGPGGAGGSVFN
jgi:hypothetical protein